jgi:hypothetical protein
MVFDTSTAPNPGLQDGVKSAASIDKLRTLSSSKRSINPEPSTRAPAEGQTPGFIPGIVEGLIE